MLISSKLISRRTSCPALPRLLDCPDKTNSQRGANRQIYNLMQTLTQHTTPNTDRNSLTHTQTHTALGKSRTQMAQKTKRPQQLRALVSATVCCARQNYKNQHSAERVRGRDRKLQCDIHTRVASTESQVYKSPHTQSKVVPETFTRPAKHATKYLTFEKCTFFH